MADKYTFTTPQQVAAPAAEATVQVIYKRRNPWIFKVAVLDDQGRLREFSREGAIAQALIATLNASNNTLKTEERRILEYLVAQGDLPATGSYSTVPD